MSLKSMTPEGVPGTANGTFQRWSSDAYTALMIRVGLGAVFVIGGWSKLSQLLDPARSDAIVALYTGPKGYINTFFLEYLFAEGSWISPWGFLTTLSTFEFISGIALLAGFLVRPLALLYGFLLWTFVFSLPVVLTPGVEVAEKTYLAPALLVQIRDITLSGLMFILFNLGSGTYSLDARLMGQTVKQPTANWDHLGLLLRLSLAATLLVGGFFAGMANIKTFGMPGFLMIAAGVAMLVDDRAARVAGGVLIAMMLIYILGKVNLDKSLIGNLNAVKREFALLAAGLVLTIRGGGDLYTLPSIMKRVGDAFGEGRRQLGAYPLRLGLKVPALALTLVSAAVAFSTTSARDVRAQGLFDGGRLAKQVVSIKTKERSGTIIVSFADRRLYKLIGSGRAISYPIGIPKAIDRWDGTLQVTQKRKNPPWRPTASMRRKNPRLPSYVPGGHPQNPMGARALYLGHTFYRIHGTDAPWTIGQAASSGCVRMYNNHAIDLYKRTKVGAKVMVTWRRYTTRPGYAAL